MRNVAKNGSCLELGDDDSPLPPLPLRDPQLPAGPAFMTTDCSGRDSQLIVIYDELIRGAVFRNTWQGLKLPRACLPCMPCTHKPALSFVHNRGLEDRFFHK
jgi:hypothetical protein